MEHWKNADRLTSAKIVDECINTIQELAIFHNNDIILKYSVVASKALGRLQDGQRTMPEMAEESKPTKKRGRRAGRKGKQKTSSNARQEGEKTGDDQIPASSSALKDPP
jgi:hypothetical protein